MATKKYERECKKLATDIYSGVYKTGCSLIQFLILFVGHKENNDDEKELEKRAKSYERQMQRAINGNLGSEKSLNKLREIYQFLLDNDDYKKLNFYKPLLDDSFERQILGDGLCDNIEKSSERAFNTSID
ncbi:hypothetical protein [Campylobacter gastrosuis]|uniref:Uncharacterized protein n=1 Tax=Campylobacter gastrosuis TaxID=2974576 RepID=A0ABT7HPV6_9BACT|nr:hypothetical protein [Campylobacter gastrosuis]MDL0088918.1 hypothetical protein [Campylobacter gastrosuis]